MMASRKAILLLALLATGATGSAATIALPPAITRQLPSGYRVLSSAAVAPDAGHRFYVIALGRRDEANWRTMKAAPARPLLIFAAGGAGATLLGRNDNVVFKADEGGQCDPFLDGEATIAVKRGYFTVENGVSCGSHWSDLITFRFDAGSGNFIFDNRRSESWSLNPNQTPDAEALIRDGPPRVVRAVPGRPVSFARWKP